MKKITVAVKRTDVFDEVALSSSYRAVKAMEGAGGERLVLTGNDRRLAHNFFDDCVARALTSLRPFVKGVVNNNDQLELDLETGDGWSLSLQPAIERHLRNYLAKGILGRWLETAGEAFSASAFEESDRELNELVATLYYREAPQRGR